MPKFLLKMSKGKQYNNDSLRRYLTSPNISIFDTVNSQCIISSCNLNIYKKMAIFYRFVYIFFS